MFFPAAFATIAAFMFHERENTVQSTVSRSFRAVRRAAPALAALALLAAAPAQAAWQAAPTWQGSTDAFINALARQSTGQLVIGGAFDTASGQPRTRLARLNADGTLDTAFTAHINAGASVYRLLVQSDDSIFVGGGFTALNGVPRASLGRLLADGTLDTAFAPPATLSGGGVAAMAVQADGKLLIGGDFVTVDGNPTHARLARLNVDGSFDSTFPDLQINGMVRNITLDGSDILIAGEFTEVDGTTRNRIARLSSAGALDNSFNPDANATVYTAILETGSGGILTGGSFANIGGATKSRLALLNVSSGADTPTFTLGVTTGSSVNRLVALGGGNVLAAGSFTSFGGEPITGLARFNTGGAGVVDTTLNVAFTPALGVGLYDVVEQADHSLVVIGNFTTAGGGTHPHIERLVNLPGAPAIASATPGPAQIALAIAAPADVGAGVTGYTATCTPVGGGAAVQASGASPLTVTAVPGTAYDCTATAQSSHGPGPASAQAGPVTPLAAPPGGGGATAAIPTLSEWALMLLALACAALGARRLGQANRY